MNKYDPNQQEATAKFSIPTASLKELHFCETSLPSFENWLDRLPVLDPNKLVDPVLNAVSQLAVLDAKGMQLFNFISRLEGALKSVHVLLEKRYQKRIQDQSNVDKRALEIAHKLDSRLLMIYQRILNREPLSMNQRGESTFRAMECLFRIVLRCGFLYLATPKGVWSKLHKLFQYAEDQALFVKSFNRQHPGKETLSIMNLYLQILLIKCCHPKQLQTNQLKKLCEQLPAISDAVKFGPVSKLKNSLYVVDTSGAKPPLYRDPKASYPDHMHGLDVYPIVQDLQGDIDASNLAAKLRPDLAFQLKHAWSQRPVRVIERIQDTQSVRLIIGFSAIFQRLAAEKTPSEFVRVHFPLCGLPSNEMPQDRHSNPVTTIRAHLVNESKCGLGVKAKNFPKQLSSGELIMILSEDETFFGVVRWIESNTANDIDFGVQLFATAMQPVAIQSFTQYKTWTSIAPAFIVAHGIDNDDQPYLIAPKTEAMNADVIRLFTRSQEIFIKLDDTQIMTGSLVKSSFRQVSSLDMHRKELRHTSQPYQKRVVGDQLPLSVTHDNELTLTSFELTPKSTTDNHELAFTDFELNLEQTDEPITQSSIDNECIWSTLYTRR